VTAVAVLCIKKLKGSGIILAAARHNRRAIAAELGAASHIDPSRCRLNVRMAGPGTPEAVAELAQCLMAEAGACNLRRDAVRALESVFSLPAGGGGVDPADYFARCIEWAGAQFGPVLSADVHHDEAAPHLHVLCLPLRDGRMVGSDLVGGPPQLRRLQTAFHADVACGFGLKCGAPRLSVKGREALAGAVLAHLKASADPVLTSPMWPAIRDAIESDPRQFAQAVGLNTDGASKPPKKPGRTFADIMTSRGKGARTLEAERRRDRKLTASKPIGFGAFDVGSDSPPANDQKTRTLCSVGFASATAHPDSPDVPCRHASASEADRLETPACGLAVDPPQTSPTSALMCSPGMQSPRRPRGSCRPSLALRIPSWLPGGGRPVLRSMAARFAAPMHTGPPTSLAPMPPTGPHR